jgi:hypothetical protein
MAVEVDKGALILPRQLDREYEGNEKVENDI